MITWEKGIVLRNTSTTNSVTKVIVKSSQVQHTSWILIVLWLLAIIFRYIMIWLKLSILVRHAWLEQFKPDEKLDFLHNLFSKKFECYPFLFSFSQNNVNKMGSSFLYCISHSNNVIFIKKLVQFAVWENQLSPLVMLLFFHFHLIFFVIVLISGCNS